MFDQSPILTSVALNSHGISMVALLAHACIGIASEKKELRFVSIEEGKRLQKR